MRRRDVCGSLRFFVLFRLTGLGEKGTPENEDSTDDFQHAHGLPENNRAQNHGGQGLQIAHHRHGLHRQPCHGGEVALAGEACVYNTQYKDGEHVRGLHGKTEALTVHYERRHCHEGGDYLQSGVFKTSYFGGLLV